MQMLDRLLGLRVAARPDLKSAHAKAPTSPDDLLAALLSASGDSCPQLSKVL